MLNQPKDTYDADYAEEPWEEDDVSLSLSNTVEEFFQRFHAVFENMTPEEKCTLSTGKVVEDGLYKLGKKCKFEQ